MSPCAWFVLGWLVVCIAVGCSTQEPPAAPVSAPPSAGEPAMPASHPPVDSAGAQPIAPPAGPRQVQVPTDVQAAWKSVVLEVKNRTADTTQDVEVPIGQSVVVGGLEITAVNFLPNFSMGGDTITSASNDTQNPAVKLTVKEGGKEVFSGWLFSLYPEAHPFQHATYGIVLKDFKKN